MFGFVVRLMVPYRRIWGRLTPRPDGGSSLSIAAVGRRDSDLDAEFTSLVTEIRQAVSRPGAQLRSARPWESWPSTPSSRGR